MSASRLILVAGVVLSVALAGPALGEQRTWISAAGNFQWFDAGNWAPAGAPEPNDTLTVGFGWTLAGLLEPVRIDGGSATFTGAGTAGVFDHPSFVVGAAAEGDLSVLGGASLKTGEATLGGEADGNGTAVVTGRGSTWDTSGLPLTAGSAGAGSVEVGGGGRLVSGEGVLGAAAGSRGEVRVAGGSWQARGAVTVGAAGSGRLEVSAMGSLTSTDGRIAAAEGAEGTVVLGGFGTLWDDRGGLFVGGTETTAGGTGLLRIEQGATASVGGAMKLWPGGSLELAGGTALVETLDTSAGGALSYAAGAVIAGDGIALGGRLELAWDLRRGRGGAPFGGGYDVLLYRGERQGRFEEVVGRTAYLAGIDYDVELGGGRKAVRLLLREPLGGDCDLDGRVDRADLEAIAAAMRRGGGAEGDCTGDGLADWRDYLQWKAHEGQSVAPAALPEPAGGALLAAGTAAMLCGGRRRRRGRGD